MGSQVSSNKDKPTTNVDKLDNSSYNIVKNADSNYFGVKSQTNSIGSSYPVSEDNKTTTSYADEKLSGSDLTLEHYKVQFEWRYGGDKVYLTGSFSNWSQWFLLTNFNGIHKIELVIEFN